MAVDTQPRPGSGRAAKVGLIAVLVFAFLLLALLVFWAVTGGLAIFAGGLSTVADRVASGAEQANQSLTIGGDEVLAPNTFIRVQDQYVLLPTDLPTAYYRPEGETGRVSNREYIGAAGELQGKQFVSATGRVDGWETRLKRTTNKEIAPAGWYSTIDVFETNDGASLALSPEWFWVYADPERAPTEWLKDGCDLGQECLMWVNERFDQVERITILSYHVAFRFHNVVVWVNGHGLDVDITADDVLDAARAVLVRLAEQPLVSE